MFGTLLTFWSYFVVLSLESRYFARLGTSFSMQMCMIFDTALPWWSSGISGSNLERKKSATLISAFSPSIHRWRGVSPYILGMNGIWNLSFAGVSLSLAMYVMNFAKSKLPDALCNTVSHLGSMFRQQVLIFFGVSHFRSVSRALRPRKLSGFSVFWMISILRQS